MSVVPPYNECYLFTLKWIVRTENSYFNFWWDENQRNLFKGNKTKIRSFYTNKSDLKFWRDENQFFAFFFTETKTKICSFYIYLILIHKNCLPCAIFYLKRMIIYDNVRISGFTLGGLSKFIHCMGLFISTRQDKYGIATVLLQFYSFFPFQNVIIFCLGILL